MKSNGNKMEKKRIPSKEVYVIFNFKTRKVFCINNFDENFKNSIDCLPANFRETEIFLKNFYNKGKKEALFREYKEFDKLFHGTAKYKKVYETLELDEYQYIRCLRIISNKKNNCNSISEVFNYLTTRAAMDEGMREKEITTELKKYMFLMFREFLKELSENINKNSNKWL
jgi:hypothetical protein